MTDGRAPVMKNLGIFCSVSHKNKDIVKTKRTLTPTPPEAMKFTQLHIRLTLLSIIFNKGLVFGKDGERMIQNPLEKRKHNMKKNASLIGVVSGIFKCCEEDGTTASPNPAPLTTTTASPNAAPLISTTASPNAVPLISTTASPNPAPLTITNGSKSPTHGPSLNPTYSEKQISASDGEMFDIFGDTCAMSKGLLAVGAPDKDDESGSVYLFNLDGTELAKLDAGDDRVDGAEFGSTIALDEKLVVGTEGTEENNYLKVFSRSGELETTIRHDEWFGYVVATHGDKILTNGRVRTAESYHDKALLYSTNGDKLKEFDHGTGWISAVALSAEWIVFILRNPLNKTFLYSNSGDFPKNLEIDQDGSDVAVSGDKFVIGNHGYNGHGQAWLYKTDGTLIKELLDPFLAFISNGFGYRVQFIEDKILVSSYRMNMVFIYSSETGDHEGQISPEDNERLDYFGSSLCADSETYYAVGAEGKNVQTGSIYIYRLSDLDHGLYDYESFGDVKTAF